MSMVRELRQAFRSLLVRPGWSAVALVNLALGIGANGAIFSLAYAVFLQALPYPQAHRLVAVESIRDGEGSPLSYPNFLDLRQGLVNAPGSSPFEELAVFAQKPFNVVVEGETRHVATGLVSAQYFELLGHEPRLGRGFTEERDAEGEAWHVAVLSDGFWRRHFAGRDFTDGITIRINGELFEVVGVMAPGFHGLIETTAIWVPATAAATLLNPAFVEARSLAWFEAVGRLVEGADLAGAGAAAEAVMARLEDEFPVANRAGSCV